jgi:sporulation-control protein spo0M
LPFFQGFEYHAYRTAYGNQVDALEIIFLGRQTECEVLVRINTKSSFMGFGDEKYGRFLIPYFDYEQLDMAAAIDRAIRSAL